MSRTQLAILGDDAGDDEIDSFLSALGAKPAARGVAQDYIKGEHGYFEGARPKGSTPAEGDAQVLQARAKDVFGVTHDINEAGYITPDGTMLDFSGRHYATGYHREGDHFVPDNDQPDYLAGQRNVDHRELGPMFPDFAGPLKQPYGETYSNEGRMHALVNAGFIRISPGSTLGFEISRPMTEAQVRTVMAGSRQIASDAHGGLPFSSFGIDVVNEYGDTVAIFDNWETVGVSAGSLVTQANAAAKDGTAAKAHKAKWGRSAEEVELFRVRFDNPVRGGPQHWTKGAGGLFTGALPGGALHPVGTDAPAKGGFQTDDPTKMENLPPELQAKLLAQVQKAVPGLTPEQMRANIERELEAGLKDPTNDGAGWYDAAHAEAVRIAKRDGITTEQAVGVIAALSPQTGWDVNLSYADFMSRTLKADPVVRLDRESMARVIAECKTERYPRNQSDPTAALEAGTQRLSAYPTRQQAVILKAIGKGTVQGGLTDSAEKAISIYRGGTPDAILGGHKVRSFYNNIMLPRQTDSVTIDTHAFSAAAGEKITAGDPRMGMLTGSPANLAYGSKGTYAVFADAYRAVAANHPGLTPDQVQAIAWIQWRKFHT